MIAVHHKNISTLLSHLISLDKKNLYFQNFIFLLAVSVKWILIDFEIYRDKEKVVRAAARLYPRGLAAFKSIMGLKGLVGISIIHDDYTDHFAVPDTCGCF